MSARGNSALRNVALSAGFLVIALFVQVSNIRGRGAPADLGVVAGTLKEWSVIGSGKTLRFTINDDFRDYRVDPVHFRSAMDQRVPIEFRTGAGVEVVARRAELANASDSKNIWVRAISIDGKSILDTKAVDSADVVNDRWGYALVLFALAALIYSLIRWQLAGARPNTSLERTRER
jgi:hypothetical protein